MLAATLRFLRRNGLRIGVLFGTFALVAGFIFVQQMREAFAEQSFQEARAQVFAEQARARDLGLETSEISDLERQELTTSAETPPTAAAPFNESRIAFFTRAATLEADIRDQLQRRQRQLVAQTKDSAQAAVAQLSINLQKAKQVGVEDQFLNEFAGLPSRAQSQIDRATTVRAYRAVSTDLKAPLSKLSLLIADQETTNKLVNQYAAEAAVKNHGDVKLARASATSALSQVQANLKTAKLFQMDTAVVDAKVQKLGSQLPATTTGPDLEQLTGQLLVQNRVLQDVMTQTLPEKALTISLREQTIRAYSHGQQVWWSYVTTGRPGLETDPGNFKVYWKVSPWTMHSPWPKGSPYWYPDSPVSMVMWFNGGAGMHDAPWRSVFGPGTNFRHYDPTGYNTGTHGCVNVPYRNMLWLWNWTPTGAPVIVY